MLYQLICIECSNGAMMFADIFRSSLLSKLGSLLKASRTEGFQCGHQVHCHISPRPKNYFGFSASIVTNDAHRGDVNGIYHFFQSKDYPTFREALVALTAQVANASLKVPEMRFFRIFGFGSEADVQHYYAHHAELADSDRWLERAVLCDWKARHYFVCEQFESGSWTLAVTEGPEVLELLSDEIHPLNVQSSNPSEGGR